MGRGLAILALLCLWQPKRSYISAQSSPPPSGPSAAAIKQENPHVELTKPTSLVVSIDSDAPPETLAYVASIAKKSRYETKHRQTVEDLARAKIGIQYHATAALFELNPDLETSWAAKGKNSIIPAHATVVLPEVTAPPPKYSWVPIFPGSTVSDAADRLGNKTDPASLERFKALNKSLMSLDMVPAYTKVRLPNMRSLQIVSLEEGLDAEQESRKLLAMRGVHLAVPNYEGSLEHPVEIAADALASSGAHYDITHLSDQWFIDKVGADQLTSDDLSLKDEVYVAILDSGLDLSHPAFKGNLWNNSSQGSYPRNRVLNDEHGYDFSSNVSTPDDTLPDSHGTHVAGIASARFLGKVRTALGADRLDSKIKLMILRVADNDEHVSLATVQLAADYAGFNNARVVSGSWTMRDYPFLSDAFQKNARTLFVIAAGNGVDSGTSNAAAAQGANIDEHPNEVFPACYRLRNVITVAASDPENNRAYFSNWGPKTVHLLAPGVYIKSTVIHNNDEYALGYNSGTSQAAPFVTLAAALILTTDNNLTVDSVKKRILYTADIDPAALKYVGYGRLNLLKAAAIKEDLIELSDRHTYYRGKITNSILHFASDGTDCAKAKTFSVAKDSVFRVLVDFDRSTGRLFLGTHPTDGRLCDRSISIQTNAGTINVPTDSVHDIIWRGIPQFELPW